MQINPAVEQSKIKSIVVSFVKKLTTRQTIFDALVSSVAEQQRKSYAIQHTS